MNGQPRGDVRTADRTAGVETAAQQAIRYHTLAVTVNAGGLGLGILLVFLGGLYREYVVYVGVGIVVLSIFWYLYYRWRAGQCELRATAEPESERPTSVELVFPETVTLESISSDFKVTLRRQ